jgi:hypothetical protein
MADSDRLPASVNATGRGKGLASRPPATCRE